MEKDTPAPASVSRESGLSRRSFLTAATITGVSAVLPLSLLGEEKRGDDDHVEDGLRKGDRKILIAAEIAEALAVTTYTNIIHAAPFFGRLADDDQGYLRAAREEEMSHYLLEQSVTAQPSPFTRFFYPPRMFDDANHAQHPGYIGRCLHRRLSGGCTAFQHGGPSCNGRPDHGH